MYLLPCTFFLVLSLVDAVPTTEPLPPCRDSNCRGIAADAAGNIYLALIEHPYHDASCALLLQLTADTYKIVQLARITVQESGGDSPSGLTVAPDGQQIYMGMEDGRVLRCRAPYTAAAQPEQVVKLDTAAAIHALHLEPGSNTSVDSTA
jgi:hypothetical protein